MRRLKVYVAHPFQGKIENIEMVQFKIREWVELSQNITFVSPLHALGFLFHDTTWEEGLEMCFDLMDDCDCVLFCNGWETSKGCNAEMIRCINRGQKYYFEKDIMKAFVYRSEKEIVEYLGNTCYTEEKGGGEMDQFEIGDIVELLTPVYTFDKKGTQGTVKHVGKTFIDVDFEGHEGLDSYPVSVLKLITRKPPVEVHHFGNLKVVFNYPRTIVVHNGITAKVSLFKEDTYDKWKGFEEAMKKLVKMGGI